MVNSASPDKFHRVLFEQSPDGIMIDDGTGHFVDVNPTLCKWLGYTREEFFKLTVRDLIDAESLRKVPLMWDELRAGKTIMTERQLVCKDGKRLAVEMTASALPNGQFLVHTRDNTLRINADEQAARRLTALTRPLDEAGEIGFHELFNIADIQQLQDKFAKATGVASIITETDGTPITRPSNFCRLCEHIIRGTEKGRRNCFYSDAMIGRHNPSGPIVQPCLSGGLWDAGASITVGGRHVANWLIGQVRNESQDESRLVAYAREIGVDEQVLLESLQEVTPMSLDQFSNIADMLFTLAGQLSDMAFQNIQQARVITERDKATEALNISQERFRVAFQTSPDSININRVSDGKYVAINDGFTRMSGYTAEEVIGKTSTELNIWANPADRDHLVKVLNEADTITNFEAKFRIKDGSTLTGLMSASVILLENAPHIISITREIEELKRAQAELLLAKEKAEESSRLKTAFLNNISHEVRTPMNAIMGFTDVLRTDELTPGEGDKFLEIIQSNSRQLLGIIDDVLEVSRMDSGKIPVNKSVFCVKDLLVDLHLSFSALVSKKNLVFTCLCKENPNRFLIHSDREKIRQVLSGFISNAVKFTPAGEILLGYQQSAGNVEFFVKDTGIGIDPPEQEKIFDRFYQVDSGNTHDRRGTGLGLSIAKGIADIMEGNIRVESTKGKGTTFFFSVPADEISEDPDNIQVQKHFSMEDLTVLIAEDEPYNYEYVRAVLSRKVKRIIWAMNGDEAVKSVEKEPPDLVLMDIKMPVMDGLEATRRITGMNKGLPVIALTAFTQPEDERLAYDAGCCSFLSKPILSKDLLEAIRKVFS
jgi:PAS domain S-box-containing protein